MEPTIFVRNVADGDVTRHALLLLECEFMCDWDLPTNVLAEVQIGDAATYWPVAPSGRFKALVHLPRLGAHDIVINVAECYTFLSVTYACPVTDHKMRFYYQKCAGDDGTFDAPLGADNSEAMAVAKIKFNALLLQTAMATLLPDHETFALEVDEDGQPIVHVIETSFGLAAAHAATDQELYALVAKDMEALGYHHCVSGTQWKHAVLLGCARYNPSTRKADGHLALGGNAHAMFGACGLHTWAAHVGEVSSKFLDATPIDASRLLDDSCHRKTHWANYATGLGAFLHELGHALGLGHAVDGIMARGFDNLNRLFCIFEPTPCFQGAVYTHAYADGKLMLHQHQVVEVSDVQGAHWHRADVLRLRTSKWLATSRVPEANGAPAVNWRRDLLGPIGYGTHDGPLTLFEATEETVAGILITSAAYVDRVEQLSPSTLNDLLLADLSVGGNQDLFVLLDHEYILRVDVHAVAWVDGLRFHTNLRTTRMYGGGMGIAPRSLVAPPGHYIASLFGAHGDHHLGRIGAVVRRLPSTEPTLPPAPTTVTSGLLASAFSSLFGPTVHSLPAVGDGAYDGDQDPFSFKDGLGAVVLTCATYVTNLKCLSVPDAAAHLADGLYCSDDQHVFALVPGEHLVQVDVRSGAWIDAIRFVTNKRVTPWYGGDGGVFSTLVCPPKHAIVGFFGSIGDNYVGTLGAYYLELPPMTSVPAPTSVVAPLDAPVSTPIGVVIVASATDVELVETFASMAAYAELCAKHPQHVVFVLAEHDTLVQVDVCRRTAAWYGHFDVASLAYLSAPSAYLSHVRIAGADVSYEFAETTTTTTAPAFLNDSTTVVDVGEANACLDSRVGLVAAVVCRHNNGDALVDTTLEWSNVSLDTAPPSTWYVSRAVVTLCLPDAAMAHGLLAIDAAGVTTYAPSVAFP
ncbi:hypothetical protein SPRG_13735 [Saprolegnia parasitica CBS 223.65]|uniref:Jacalin-type lectin domain-containing protein n=1 Tax=Saprolegnia parasitica (strain CBS 223.65) TaxID=695850 RepID=A0A067C3X7_SAPPC|nr:hypothetical protein SPRG_13735 [Saprolegnia parasitica CBS 223.65]KDO21236.1 hypothetical protein SPRG_13735 [Saprolegnia parasitica CBS 223.65]|eukprot:XP_012208068.1 hypothetical protein SPRG_13735 [Saprolegnia parasitica CBS 223.65]